MYNVEHVIFYDCLRGCDARDSRIYSCYLPLYGSRVREYPEATRHIWNALNNVASHISLIFSTSCAK